MSDDPIGDRFKRYERCYDFVLPWRMPMIIRVDGRGFHGLKLKKPFDNGFSHSMAWTAVELCTQIPGTRYAYVQSDEISLVVRDDQSHQTQPWVGKRLSKVLSLSAAMATRAFNKHMCLEREFDSRAFVLPDYTEVENYLIWRQQDATRNSVSMMAHAYFSHKELQGKSSPMMRTMLEAAGHRWEDLETYLKRGTGVRRCTIARWVPALKASIPRKVWAIDGEIPIFTQDRQYLRDQYDFHVEGEEVT